MGSYIKLDRKILEWGWYKNINTKIVFLHLLLKANWKEGIFEGKVVPRGSFVTSAKSLAAELDLTEDEIRTAIKHLVSTKEITKQITNKYTVISIVNYDMYQSDYQTNPKQIPFNSQTIPKLFPTIEEGKKGNKEEDYRVSKDTLSQTDVRLAIQQWNNLAEFGIKPISKCNSGSKRYESLCARIREYGIEDVINAIDKIKVSDFLQGKNDKGWTIAFDWFVKPSNFPKVLEGNYDNKESEKGERIGTNTRANETEYNPYDYY